MATTTRERLLDAAISALIDAPGEALTTGRLAARAGVVQSAFYNHFSSVDECRAMATAAVKHRITSAASTFFAELRGPESTTNVDVEQMLLHVYGRVDQQRPEFALLVRRSHSSEIGALVDDVLAELRVELTETMLRNSPAQSPMGPPEAATAAAFAIAVIVSGIELVLAGADAVATAQQAALFITSGVFSFHGLWGPS